MEKKLLALPLCVMALFLLGLPLPDQSTERLQPTPTLDRLAAPVLPENPSQVDIGRSLYYYNCMPCHGDNGQGLTDEFRGIWEEDHQNCWASGCHSGRTSEEGFPLPKTVPAINIASRSEQLFPANDDLYEYLRTTHPPQDPGWLQDDEYHALAAYLFSLAGRQSSLSDSNQKALTLPGLTVIGLAALLVGLLLFTSLTLRRHHQRG
jgi:mono/diheme cytochrome c family protein